jgi:hypothetical protein
MSNASQTWTIIGGVVAFVGLLIGVQTFWIVRALDEIGKRLDRIDARLEHIEGTTLRGHGERIARLEAKP